MLRPDFISGQLRILATERKKRLGPKPEGCPFCPGNEEVTPPEIDRVEVERQWQARVVPNLYPLAETHEVFILSPRHVTTTRALRTSEWAHAVHLWKRRLAEHAAPDTYTHIFVNDGRGAGASLEHTHAQLVVVPRLPGVAQLVNGVRDERCALCQLRDPRLEVWQSGPLTLSASPTPRANDALLLYPAEHEVSLEEVPEEAVAEGLRTAVAALPDADFNCWLVHDPQQRAHWYVELVPRTSVLAGVELGLGVPVSIVDPHEAAEHARARIGDAAV